MFQNMFTGRLFHSSYFNPCNRSDIPTQPLQKVIFTVCKSTAMPLSIYSCAPNILVEWCHTKTFGAVLDNQIKFNLTNCFKMKICTLISLWLKRHSHSFKYSSKCSFGMPLNLCKCRFSWFQRLSIPFSLYMTNISPLQITPNLRFGLDPCLI